jgi:hypothetical protein
MQLHISKQREVEWRKQAKETTSLFFLPEKKKEEGKEEKRSPRSN